MLQLYSKAEGEITSEFRSNKSISLADSIKSGSRKACSSKLNPELVNKSDVLSQSRASSVYPESMSDYQAPNIMVIEDKTQFLVSKHIQGIPQAGFEHAFSPVTAVKNNLAEKARLMSAKSKTKPENEPTKEPENPKPKVSEEEYIQRLLMQFEEEGNKKEEKPNKTTENMKRLLKQATLIKNELNSSNAESAKKSSDLHKPSGVIKDKVVEDSDEKSDNRSNSRSHSGSHNSSRSRKSSPERKLEDDPTPEQEVREVKKEPVKKEEKMIPIKNNEKIESIKKEEIKTNTNKIPPKIDLNIKKTTKEVKKIANDDSGKPSKYSGTVDSLTLALEFK